MRRLIIILFVWMWMGTNAQLQNSEILLLIPENSEVLETNLNNSEFPRVLPDNCVIFKFYAPNVDTMKVFMNDTFLMNKDKKGIWTLTTEPLDPGFHYYSYIIDGVRVSDPNSEVFYGYNFYSSGIDIPEKGVDFYITKAVPHGEIRTVNYYSKVTESWRPMNIYTPPGYNESDKEYPVLYIQHGGGENHEGWVKQGKIQNILDNLISEGRAEEMVAVITNGNVGINGLEIIPEEVHNIIDHERIDLMEAFVAEIHSSIIPFVESHYRVKTDKNSRAITGLSRGGGFTLSTVLTFPDQFGYIGIFSSSTATKNLKMEFSDAFKVFKENEVKLFWTGAGLKDNSHKYTQTLVEILKENQIPYVWKEFSGGHEWQVWRKSLYDFAPRLFKD